jgi:hypothetical protein
MKHANCTNTSRERRLVSTQTTGHAKTLLSARPKSETAHPHQLSLITLVNAFSHIFVSSPTNPTISATKEELNRNVGEHSRRETRLETDERLTVLCTQSSEN